MEHGTLWGHGAYLGPDFSAEYLHQETESIRELLGNKMFGKPFEQLSPENQGAVSELTIRMIKENRYNADTDTLIYTDEEISAFDHAVQYWSQYFQEGAPGLPANYI